MLAIDNAEVLHIARTVLMDTGTYVNLNSIIGILFFTYLVSMHNIMVSREP